MVEQLIGIFSTLLPIIIIGVVVGRVVGRAAKAQQQGTQPTEAQPRPASPQPRPASPQPRPAGSRSRPASSQPRPMAAKQHAAEYAQANTVGPYQSVVTDASGEPVADTALYDGSDAPDVPKSDTAAVRMFINRVSKLHPLVQGVIFSEILERKH